MEHYYLIIRAIHSIAASIWVGEVLVINFILIPALSKLQDNKRKEFMIRLFPKIFRMASFLATVVSISGIFMVYHLTNGKLENLLNGRWGLSILTGGSLGIILSIFHFYMANRLLKRISLGRMEHNDKLTDVYLKLKIIPRMGMIIILTILVLMINAAHWIF